MLPAGAVRWQPSFAHKKSPPPTHALSFSHQHHHYLSHSITLSAPKSTFKVDPNIFFSLHGLGFCEAPR